MDIPSTWEIASLSQIAELNPRLDKSSCTGSTMVSFVPMRSVEAGTGAIDVSQTRSLDEVKKGFRPFRPGDVLFAKITPCMENGKVAVAPSLKNGIGFGSTEFHVFRPRVDMDSKYIYFFVSSNEFRKEAEHNMTGAVGQRRVPISYLAEKAIPVPPAVEQHRIVAKIEELFSELDKGVEALNTARAQLADYRQTVLKHAFEGKLTAEWREQNKERLESPEQLLARIEEQGQASYKRQISEWRKSVEELQACGGRGKRLNKPKKHEQVPPLTESELAELPDLPRGWKWAKYEALTQFVRNGIARRPDGTTGEKILRISAVRPMNLNTDDYRLIEDSDGNLSQFRLCKGDIVFTRYNGSRKFVGVCAEYRCEKSRVIPDKLIQTRVFSEFVSSSYVEKAVHAGASRRFMESRIRTTAGQSGISGSDIKALPIPLCSRREQDKICNMLEPQLAMASQLEKDIEDILRKIEALRQSILRRAFSGHLVSQDLNDEPASILLERISARLRRLAK